MSKAPTYYELVDRYGAAGAERIVSIAENFTNQVRMKMDTAVQWAISQYEASQELPDRMFQERN